ncbi:MAG TPA: hypothetical protein VHC22_17040 [Pirellulales bacterium]|nr:hypothetical protein [Pirellulales bacterium]
MAVGDSAYIVDDPSCPDEILLEVMGELDTRFAESVPRSTVRKLCGIDIRIVVGLGIAIVLILTVPLVFAMLR